MPVPALQQSAIYNLRSTTVMPSLSRLLVRPMMRMVVDGLMCSASSMGSPGLDGVRWLQPVRGGDTLAVRYLTTKVKASNSRPDRGVVWSKWTATN